MTAFTLRFSWTRDGRCQPLCERVIEAPDASAAVTILQARAMRSGRGFINATITGPDGVTRALSRDCDPRAE